MSKYIFIFGLLVTSLVNVAKAGSSWSDLNESRQFELWGYPGKITVTSVQLLAN